MRRIPRDVAIIGLYLVVMLATEQLVIAALDRPAQTPPAASTPDPEPEPE